MRRLQPSGLKYNDCMNAGPLSILVLYGLMAMTPAHAAPDREAKKKACTEVKLKIRKLESRMRAGYSAAQGIRLEEKLRKLKKVRYRVCG